MPGVIHMPGVIGQHGFIEADLGCSYASATTTSIVAKAVAATAPEAAGTVTGAGAAALSMWREPTKSTWKCIHNNIILVVL